MYCSKVCLSSQAYLAILAETYAHTGTETGGVFLGKVENDAWYVIEVLDPGYTNIQRLSSYFEYDETYVAHLANVRARLYQNGLELLGLWHRHPGSFDRFSGTDDETHRRYTAQNPRRGAISALVNLDPHFRLTMYHIAPPVQHSIVQSVLIGDAHIPNHLLALTKPEKFTGSSHFQTFFTDVTDTNKKKSWFGKLLSKNRDNSLSETIPAQQEDMTDISASSSTATQEVQVLDMLDYEISEYLESQSDYDYDMKLHDENRVELTMQYVGNMTYYPRIIHCNFFIRNNEKRCVINNKGMSYIPGIIKQYVNGSVDDKMRRRQSNSPQSGRRTIYPANNRTDAPAITLQQERPIASPTIIVETSPTKNSPHQEKGVNTYLSPEDSTPQKKIIADKSQAAVSTTLPDKVLFMWRNEESYLKSQNDYEYQVHKHDNYIEIIMKHVGENQYNPREIHCKFFMDGNQKKCLINNEQRLYEYTIIKSYILNYAFNQTKG